MGTFQKLRQFTILIPSRLKFDPTKSTEALHVIASPGPSTTTTTRPCTPSRTKTAARRTRKFSKIGTMIRSPAILRQFLTLSNSRTETRLNSSVISGFVSANVNLKIVPALTLMVNAENVKRKRKSPEPFTRENCGKKSKCNQTPS